MLALDHVMYVVPDLDEAARRVRDELGLDSYPGGEHSGVGTANRVVPIGDGQYVELMGVSDEATASSHPVGRHILALAGEGPRLRSWCLATDDIDGVAQRLGLESSPWTRLRPDGSELRWRLAGAEVAMGDPSLPFFIQWDCPPEVHPSRQAVDHPVAPKGVAWLEVGGDADRIRAWTDGADLPVRVVDGAPGPRALGIATAKGEIILR